MAEHFLEPDPLSSVHAWTGGAGGFFQPLLFRTDDGGEAGRICGCPRPSPRSVHVPQTGIQVAPWSVDRAITSDRPVASRTPDVKKSWGSLTARWVPHDLRDRAVDFVRYWSERTGLAQKLLVIWLGIQPSKYYDWRERDGKMNAHNGKVPRDF